MRKLTWIMPLFLAAGISAPVQAQRAVSFGGAPREITFKPVDTTKAVVAPVSTPQSRFSVMNYVPKLSLPGFLKRKGPGGNPLPTPGSFPATQYKSPFVPVAPLVSKN